ncbi:MAG: Nif11-like leader peptide family natural product precursor, partial [Proteobacteria bacterium]|nr:Nif11-like leader peptide family natural product precursor [Pseudomonadota bacterium]
MNNDDIIASLLRTHDFRQIDQFVQTVRTDPRAIAHFTRCGATPEAAVSLARQYGYDFDLAALEAWIDRAIAALAAARAPDQ